MKKNFKKNNLSFIKIFCLISSIMYPNFLYNSCCSACGCQSCEQPCVCDFCFNNVNSCNCGQINKCAGAPFLQYRSVSLNKAKEICGWQPYTFRYGMEKLNGSIYTSVEYTDSFRPNNISQYLFGDDLVCGNKLIIQGSKVENRNPKAWLADYFGLPVDFQSQVQFCPTISNVIVDLNSYFGLDRIAKGLYLKLHFPIASTKWALNMAECVCDPGQETFPIGYMGIGQEPYKPTDGGTAPQQVKRSSLPADFISAVQPGTTFCDQKVSMQFGCMPCVQLQYAQFSDFHATLGYDFVLKKDFNFAAGFYLVFPSGTRPDARVLFEPIIGNGKHWELGGEINSSWIFYRSQNNENRYAGIWLDATLTHMLNAYQPRQFDFCGRPNSRYMLLLQMNEAANTTTCDLVGTQTTAVKEFSDYSGATIIPQDPNGQTVAPQKANYTYAQYENTANTNIWSGLIPAINYSTRVVNVRVDLQADVAIKLGYIGQDFSFDIGYELWARTPERITPCQSFCQDGTQPQYVIKGDGFIWAKDENSNSYFNTLSGSQNCADIHTGQNMILAKTDPAGAAANKGVDNPEFAWELTYAGNRGFTHDTFIQQVNPDGDPIYSSFQPKLVHSFDLDTCQSATALTNKIFAHINYEWKDKETRWRPFAGIGAESEFAPRNRKFRAISQWGLWLKAGVAFQ